LLMSRETNNHKQKNDEHKVPDADGPFLAA
jgi:hypothetical protein